MIYLLDTNVWVQFLRNKNALVVQRIHAHQPSELRVCTVTAAELYFGCLKSAKPAAHRATVDAVLAPYSCLQFDRAADEFAQIRLYLESHGTPIGPYDMQIAAIARANGLTLVSHNTSEFSRVPGLLLEDWELP
ncbi:MAG: type II toxin-antitoxin system VapC family toxin [Gemmataceae bacterium]|nr:type II toxin-antitoxin system VapC family toxin [Gemmataceae bacterium]